MRIYNKTKIASVLALSAAVMSFAQSSNENYVQSRTCLNDDCSRRSETITYFDGLGRPKQIVSVKSTPTGKDLVTPVTYDGFGRQVKDILPVPVQTQNSAIHSGIVDESAANTYYGVTNAYSEKQMENSPLDRLLQQAAPGEAWKMSSGKTQKFSYDANLGNEVKKFVTVTTTSTVNNVSTGVSVLSVSSANSGFYPASTLYKNTVTDEDGNPVTEFKNGQGQTLLIRRNDGSQNIDTYYVYNEYNQLAFVISPKAVKQIELNNNGITDEILNELCYRYKYDGRSRLVEKKIPGKDWEFMVYDKQDRLVLSQDGKLRTADNTFTTRGWLFTKYDEFGRVAYTGFYPNTDSRTQVQDQLNTLTASSPNTEIRITNPISLSGTNLYYRNQAFPSLGITLLTVSYYDTYPSEAPAVPATVLGQPTMSQNLGSGDDASTKGLVTSSYVKNIEDNNWTKAYHYYDSMGRQIAVKTTNHLGGYTNTETELDFAGVAKLSKTYHKRLATDTERVITETFEYDNQNRLLVHKHKVDNNPEEILAQHTYNDLSQLTNKKVGGTVASSPLQSIDYLYNIRGWMTRINDPKNLGSKLFGYEIKYNTVEGLETPNVNYTNLQVNPRYNGNIAEVDWRTGTVSGDNLRRYGYVYDSLNRLSAGFYQKDSNPSAKEYFEKMDYDLNGNITNLKRSAESQQGAAAFNIDELSYVYSGNKLTSVTDSSTDYRGYPDVSGITIPYDINGNMTSQRDKGILQIDYNFLNLPNYLKFDDTYIVRNAFGGINETRNITTKYIFRADGTKVSKLYTYGIARNRSEAYKMTEYLDGFQYESNAASTLVDRILRFVPTSEGYYNFENNKYIYNYTDHLGNVRLSYFNNSNSIEVLEENNYYPFGMKHEGYNVSAGNSSYQYKYNGKELQTESGMYTYKFRQLMVDVPHWITPDPLAELYPGQSPYAMMSNNPMNRIDPLGLTDYKVNGEIRTIDDGHNNVTITITERQFNRLQNRFNKEGSGYERLMNRLSERNGYTITSSNGSSVTDGFTITNYKPGGDSYGQWSIQNNHQTYGTVEHIARVMDAGLGSTTGQFGNINIGSNNKLYFRQNTGRIFNGNQYVRTVSAASRYSKFVKGAKIGGLVTGVALGGYEIYQGVQQDGGTYGYNAQVQTAGAVGGLAGGWAGAEGGAAVGAAIGVWFGGVGAVPGAIIGGLIGGAAGAWAGDYYGEKAAKAIIE